MTNEQRAKLKEMDDLRLLIELCLAFGNTDDHYLGSYHRRNIMKIFEDLNLETINYLIKEE